MFEPVEEIKVPCDGITRRIVLARGDLAHIDPADQVDLLVISAFPDDYTPTPSSLIGQLAANGVSVEQLSATKARDLRDTTGAWLSQPLETAGFKRLVCFEPHRLGSPPKVVGKLFRALFPFLSEEQDQIIAMPLISGGDAGWPAKAMLPPMLEAAVGWLRLGLPVATLFIVTRSETELEHMHEAFQAERKRTQNKAPYDVVIERTSMESQGEVSHMPSVNWAKVISKTIRNLILVFSDKLNSGDLQDSFPGKPTVHIFLSFSSKDAATADHIAARFLELIPQARVFDFRRNIEIGMSYQREIDAALKKSNKVLCLLSPDYIGSAECQEELMVSRLRAKRLGLNLLWPVYWRDQPEGLEDWIMIHNIADCREKNHHILDTTIEKLANSLPSDGAN